MTPAINIPVIVASLSMQILPAANSDSTVTASPSKEIEAFTSSSETHSGVGSPVRKRLGMEDLAVPGPSHIISNQEDQAAAGAPVGGIALSGAPEG
nr:unnamed protein product [Callosobruchus chinensis]